MNDKQGIRMAMNDPALAKMFCTIIKHRSLNQNKTQVEVADSAIISLSTLTLVE